MSHPADRGARRRCRKHCIATRTRDIPWARCPRCFPAPCKCADRAIQRGRLAKTPVPCSCPACGNPRYHFKACTIGELRAPGVEDMID